MTLTTDTARLPLLLTELRLPTVAKLWASHAFKTEMDDEARRSMFPQNERLKPAAR